MKKIIAMMLALMLVLCLCACGDDATNNDSSKNDNTADNGTNNTNNDGNGSTALSDTPVGYALTVKGCTFGIGMDAEKVVAKLGEHELTKSESCGAMGGNDYDYNFGDYVIYANDGNGAIRIYSMSITSDLVETPEGLTIGSTVEEVTGTLGQPTSQTATLLDYEKDGVVLRFSIDDDTVQKIDYLEK